MTTEDLLQQATELLREIAEKDEAALRELGDIGLDLPEETRAFLNRSRAFLGMPLL